MTTLRQAAQEYLSMRRHLGFKLHDAGKGLLDFVTFMAQHRAPSIAQALALAWAQQPSNAQPAYWARRLGFVRGFAQHRSATDPRTQIPAEGLLPFQPQRARPYLYSDAEIRDLLRAALTMPCRYARGQLRPWVYYCLFGLLSVSGLRLGEARNLELDDVDLTAAVLTIRGAKFGKTRLVPLHASTCTVLAEYFRRRQRHWGPRPVSSYVFVSSWGHRLDSGDIHRTFYALSRQVGLRGPSDHHGPRLHDLRQHAGSGIMPGCCERDAVSAGNDRFGACQVGIIQVSSSRRPVGREWRRHAGSSPCDSRHSSGTRRHRLIPRLVCRASRGVRVRLHDGSVTAEAARTFQRVADSSSM
jgi:integrase